jgi:transcriptional regulator with XRE-family HTH domain
MAIIISIFLPFVQNSFQVNTTDSVLNQLLLGQLGDRLQRLRKEQGLGTVELASEAGISRPTLRAVESGDPGTSIGIYLRVMSVLGVATELSLLASGAMGPALGKSAAARSRHALAPLKVSIEADRNSSALHDMQSLALHLAAVKAIKEDGELLEGVRQTVRRWLQNDPKSRSTPLWHEWERILTKQQFRLITGRSARAQQLRQASPLAVVLSEDQRNAILAEFRDLKRGVVFGGNIQEPSI